MTRTNKRDSISMMNLLIISFFSLSRRSLRPPPSLPAARKLIESTIDGIMWQRDAAELPWWCYQWLMWSIVKWNNLRKCPLVRHQCSFQSNGHDFVFCNALTIAGYCSVVCALPLNVSPLNSSGCDLSSCDWACTWLEWVLGVRKIFVFDAIAVAASLAKSLHPVAWMGKET